MASRPTLAKVALTAGVSKTTASYVLNGQKKMSAETTRRVKEAARRLGYRLDSSASGLSRGRSQVIGVLAVESVTELVVGANSLFWLRFNDAFIRGCSDEGLVVSFAGERRAQELIDSGIDALLVLGNHATEVFEELRVPFGLPIISLDPIPRHDNVQLSYDNDAIAAAVAGHLRDEGCTHLHWLSVKGSERVFGPLHTSLERWATWSSAHRLTTAHLKVSSAQLMRRWKRGLTESSPHWEFPDWLRRQSQIGESQFPVTCCLSCKPKDLWNSR